MLTVKFVDGELIQNPIWNSMPIKPIQKVKYIVGDKTVILEGYEEYNHLVEKVYTPFDGKQIQRAVYLIGRTGRRVHVFHLNFLKNQINLHETEFGMEYNGRPSTGWKKGSPEGIPQYKVL